MSEAIQVVVRCRPFNKKEISEGRGNAVTMDIKNNQVFIANSEEPDAPPKQFTFDAVYDENTVQRFFYEESCFALVESVLEGFNGTIFAYGQTGCGKTWTMQGPWNPPELRGVIPNAFSHVFEFVKITKGCTFVVHCSYLEIYNEEIRDLLADQSGDTRRDLREDPNRGIFVVNLTDVVVHSETEMDAVLNRGLSNRTVGSTLMNSESSRSHSIFTIIVEMNFKIEGSTKDIIKQGKLNLVDLAGSERQKKTGASGDRLKEGSKINLSLSALGNVISALSEGKSKHIPYRDSKLTRLLQDSLGGNTKTLMVAAISPADYNYDETLSTLRYANRAKSIKNKPKLNEDPKDTLLREYKEEVERLRKQLAEKDAELEAMRQGGGGTHLSPLQHHSQRPHEEHHGHDQHLPPLNHEQGHQQVDHQKSHHHHHRHVSAGTNGSVDVEASFSEEIYRASANDSSVVPGVASSASSPKDVLSIAPEHSVVAQVNGSHHEMACNVVEVVNIEDDDLGTGSPRKTPRKSPRDSTTATSESQPTVIKEIVEVKVEVIPEHHLHKHKALEEYSDALAKQRDELGDMLKLREAEVQQEKLHREELNAKLEELQRKLVGNLGTMGDVSEADLAEMDAAEAAAARRHLERRAKAKKRQEAKINAEIQKTLSEKAEVEKYLEEMKRVEDNSEANGRKLAKLKKRHMRELEAVQRENDEFREEIQAERERLLETIRDQTKEMKLFEQICRAMAPDRELRKVLEKSRWDEENCEWALPFVKKTDLDALLPTITNAYKPLGASIASSTPPVNANPSPRVSAVVPLPSTSASNRYVAESSPRSKTPHNGIAEEEAVNMRQRVRSMSKSNLKTVEPESQSSLTSLPASLVPKPPKSRSASRSTKKKGSKKRKESKQYQENDETDFVTEEDYEDVPAGAVGPVTDWGFDQGPDPVPIIKRTKTPGLPKTGKDKGEKSSPRTPRQSQFESLPFL